ncbi:MAG TPA: CvpA family protein [Verrucomicrobiae bacterium]|jgi:hypothetical protein|nr:CvpA family protein [Verrucomicrobiae bacterium]
MIAVTIKTGPWWQHLAFNWVDLALVLVLAFGFWHGRKRGMTKEFLPTIQWVLILVAASFGHIFLADWFQQEGWVRKVFGNHVNERTAALVSAYLLILGVIFIIFTLLKRKYNPKLEGSNVFGGNEYYWGVAAGLVRYVCLIFVTLALLNAPYYSPNEIAAIKQYKLNNFAAGGHVKGMEDDTGDFIPSVYEVQDTVFKNSLLGSLIKQNLSVLLINSTAAVKKTAHS